MSTAIHLSVYDFMAWTGSSLPLPFSARSQAVTDISEITEKSEGYV